MRFLVVCDVDSASVAKLAEKYVCGSVDGVKPEFDAVILLGPFVGSSPYLASPEGEAAAEGEMGSLIAQLENIVCRVVYLPSSSDPIRSVTDQLHLTPNSVNIHARAMPLIDGLYIAGFTELKSNILDDQSGIDSDDEDVDSAHVQTCSSARIMDDVLSKAPAYCYPNGNIRGSGIFLFNYKYVHTLNHFLSYQHDLVSRAAVKLAVIPIVPINDDKNTLSGNTLRLPASYGGLKIASPKSLRKVGGYTVVEMVRNVSDGLWHVSEVSDCWLDRKSDTTGLSSCVEDAPMAGQTRENMSNESYKTDR